MKNGRSIYCGVALIVAAMLCSTALGQTTWTGGVDSDWFTAGNWDAGVPTAAGQGRRALRSETSAWTRYVEVVGRLLTLERPVPA